MPIPSNLGDIRHPAPSSAPPRPARRRLVLRDQELDYLRALMDCRDLYADLPQHEQQRRALLQAGYSLADLGPGQVRSIAREIARKIDRALDMESALIEYGLGKLSWIRLISDMSAAVRVLPNGEAVPDWKYRAVALKLWGLALGVFGAPTQGQGASIIIGAQAQGEGVQVAAQVRWPQRAVPPAPEPPAGDEEPERLPPDPDVQAHFRAQRLALEAQRQAHTDGP